MEFGQYQLQIFVSLVVVLGAAFVALICDFLKRNNEQLRELVVELRVRREEEQRRPQTMHPQTLERGQHADPPRQRIHPRSSNYERNASLAPIRRASTVVSPPRRVEHRVESQPAPITAAPIGATPAATEPAVPKVATKAVAAKKDWGSLLARSNSARKGVEIQKDAVVAATASQPTQEGTDTLAIPAGFQHGSTLNSLVQSRQPISGLVVSIGVSRDGAMPDGVVSLMQSLIRAGEFACQSSDEEFLLICSGERGASAQRRLIQIAQQLWDFQLNSLGNLSVVFSWGGIEVRNEPIDEAVASAYERMQETRRGRKLLLMEPRREMAFRRAV